jgi:enoyl-CoA hydratase/carnithine racemase
MTSEAVTVDVGQVLVQRDGPVVRLTMNRPAQYNALSLELMQDLRAAIEAVSAESATRVIVLQGAGRGFSAGHDMSEMIDRDDDFYGVLFDECTRLMQSVHKVPQPVIARVHGVATAAGCQLVASCDLAIAEEGARFGTPGVRIGLFCSTPMVPVSRAVGRKRAMQMLLTGDLIDAPTARDWGLVNDVVPAAELDAAVDALAARIGQTSGRTIAIGKVAFYAQIERDEDGAYALTKDVMAANAANPDAQEGMSAFLAKRPPVWPAA